MFTIIGGINVSDLALLTAALPKGSAIRSAGSIVGDKGEQRLMEILVPTTEESSADEKEAQ
jgi:hypothetical protein